MRLRGLLAFSLCLVTAANVQAQIPKMKFGEVAEVAPGVFFRYASIDFFDKTKFGGCNNVWISGKNVENTDRRRCFNTVKRRDGLIFVSSI